MANCRFILTISASMFSFNHARLIQIIRRSSRAFGLEKKKTLCLSLKLHWLFDHRVNKSKFLNIFPSLSIVVNIRLTLFIYFNIPTGETSDSIAMLGDIATFKK